MADLKIDLDALDASTVEEVVEINPDVNPMEGPAPVDDGKHRVKILAGDAGWTSKSTNPLKDGTRKPYLATRFSFQVIEEGTKNNNKRVFHQLNTLAFDGKSEMAYVLRMIYGDTPEARAEVAKLNNYVLLAQAFKNALAAEPTIQIRTKWVAQRVEEDKDGNKKYSVVKSGQKNFPAINSGDGKPTGEYQHVILDAKTDTEVSAQATVVEYFPDNV